MSDSIKKYEEMQADQLDEINAKIKKIETAEYQNAYIKKNKDKKAASNKRWNDKNRKEYQRNYRLNNTSKKEVLNFLNKNYK